MLFVREALEQATHEAVAAYRASRFPSEQHVADLTCGIGGELIALAARGPATGFDLDPERLKFASWNLRVHGLSPGLVCGDSLAAEWSFEFAVADPARRVDGRRVRSLGEFLPDPRELARRMRSLKLGILKLTPMLPDADLESLGPGLEFVEFGGECREASVLIGTEAESGRWAVRADDGERLEAGDPGPRAGIGAFLHEASPAAIRAHALGTLCRAFGLAELGDSPGYLSGGPADSPWLRSYRVLASMPFSKRKARQALRPWASSIGAVKLRGVSEDPTKLHRALDLGSGPLALVLYGEGPKQRCAVLEPSAP